MQHRNGTARKAAKRTSVDGKPSARRVEQGCQVMGAIETVFARQWWGMIDGAETGDSSGDMGTWL